jgi:hypothetical protein
VFERWRARMSANVVWVSRSARLLAVASALGPTVALGACGAGHAARTTAGRSARSGQGLREPPAAARTGDSRRAYSGHITSGTGRYANASGTVAIAVTLKPPGTSPRHPSPSQRRYAVSLGLRGARCEQGQRLGATHACLALVGTIHGSAVEQRPSPPVGDLPTSIRIAASGRISSVGAVVAKGEMVGVGFIRTVRRSLKMTLAGNSGTVTVMALGPVAPGVAPP